MNRMNIFKCFINLRIEKTNEGNVLYLSCISTFSWTWNSVIHVKVFVFGIFRQSLKAQFKKWNSFLGNDEMSIVFFLFWVNKMFGLVEIISFVS
jgi:hypothetical protein